MAGEDTEKDTPQTESERWKAFAQGGENKSEFTPLRRTYTPSNPSGPSISVYELDTRITGMNLSTVFRTVAGAQDGHSETVRDASLRTFQSLKSDTGVQILTDGDGVTAANVMETNDVVVYSMAGKAVLENTGDAKRKDTFADYHVTPDEIIDTMRKAADATTVEKNLQTEDMNFSAPSSVSHDGKKYYDIPVTESATVLSQGFYMGFRKGKIPPEIEIIAPNGKSAKIAPSRSVPSPSNDTQGMVFIPALSPAAP